VDPVRLRNARLARQVTAEQLIALSQKLPTPRQLVVIQLLVQGKYRHEIAAELGVSPPTITTRLQKARLRMGATHDAELVYKCMKLGMFR
jgi:DNA-binding NarL/FixJ family response regulator